MIQAAPKPLTLEEFLKLPETKPASEFINGQIIQKPMPQGKHSTVQLDLGSDIHRALKPGRIARAYSELRCTFGGRSLVPDLSIFIWDRIPRDANGEVANQFFLAPDWTIEILSPDQSQTKVIRNILHCLAHGTQMGWLIDPDEKLIFIYFPDRPIAVFEALPDALSPETSPESAPFLPVPDFTQAFQITAFQLFDYLSE
jgi:Uma2 family endonuclease